MDEKSRTQPVPQGWLGPAQKKAAVVCACSAAGLFFSHLIFCLVGSGVAARELVVEGTVLFLALSAWLVDRRLRGGRGKRSVLEESLFDSSIDGVMLLDAQGIIADVNPAACATFALSKHEVIGRHRADPRWDLVGLDGHPLGAESAPSGRTLAEGRSQTGITIGIRDGLGHRKWLRANTRILSNGADAVVGAAMMTFFSDVTEQVEAQRRSEETADRLAIAIKAVRFGVWDWNLKTNELVWDAFMY